MNASTNRFLRLLSAVLLLSTLLPAPRALAQCDGVCGMSCLPPELQPLPWDPSQPRDGLFISAHGVLNVMMAHPSNNRAKPSIVMFRHGYA